MAKRQAKPANSSALFSYFAGFATLLLLFYFIYTNKTFEENLLLPFVAWQAKIVSACLNIFALNTTTNGPLLNGPGISLNVSKGCDGIEVTFLYLAGVLLMPFPWRSKMEGVLTGLGVLLLLNLFRIAVLYWAQVYWPSGFEFLHLHGGFALFTVVALLLWASWANRAMKKETPLQT